MLFQIAFYLLQPNAIQKKFVISSHLKFFPFFFSYMKGNTHYLSCVTNRRKKRLPVLLTAQSWKKGVEKNKRQTKLKEKEE
jgi:hypothetical protein